MWFASWWWPARIRELNRQLQSIQMEFDIISQRFYKTNSTLLYAEEEAKRMRERWQTVVGELEFAKEQAVLMKQERNSYILQRDEARGLVVALARPGERDVNLPEWVDHPYYKRGAL